MAANEYDALLTEGTAPAANEYDALLADERNDDRARLRQTMTAAAATEPDRAARALGYAERLNLPRGVVERNLDLVERRDAVERNDYDAILDRTPQLAEWLIETPDHAAVAADDLDTLGNLEALATALSVGYGHGRQTSELGRLGMRLADGDRDPTLIRRVAALERDLAAAPGGRGFMAQWVYPGAKIVGQMIDSGTRALETGLAGAMAGGTAAAIAGQLGPQVALPEEAVTVPAATALGFGAGLKAGFAADVYAIESGHAYLELSRVVGRGGEQIDEPQARGRGRGRAHQRRARVRGGQARRRALEGGRAQVRDRRHARRPGHAHRAARGHGVRQGLCGGGHGPGHDRDPAGGDQPPRRGARQDGDRGRVRPARQFARAAALERLFAIAGETFRGMALVGLPGATVNLAADVRNVSRARENQRFFEALGQQAEGSKLRERLPDKLRDFVDRVTRDGPVENVYIPVEAFTQYFQDAAVDPRQVAAELLGDPATYDEAVRSGEDLKIPTAVYAAKVAGTAHHQALAPDLRLAPDEMTAREAEAFVEALKGEAQTGEQAGTADQVREDVLGQLLGIGYERSTAEAYADLYASTFRALGARAGVDPVALYQRYGLRIERPLPEVLRQAPAVSDGLGLGRKVDPALD